MKVFRIAGIILGLFSFSTAALAAEPVEYFAVFADGAKIGQATFTRQVADGKVTTTHTMEITLGRGMLPMTVRQSEIHIETADGRALGFKNVQEIAAMAQTVSGTIDPAGKCHLKTTSAGQTQESTIDWPKGALLNEGVRLAQLRKGLKPGTTYSLTVFATSSLSAVAAEARVVGAKDVDLLGRVVRLTEVSWVCKMPSDTLNSTNFTNDECYDQKTLTVAAGINLEIVACSREVALSPNEPMDFFDKMILPSPAKLDGLASAGSATYRLASTSGKKLNIPALDGQTVGFNADGTVTVTVIRQKGPTAATFPYTGSDPNLVAATKPNRYLESDRPEIVALARKAVGDARDTAQAARRIEAFVRSYITTKDLSVGYATAAEVAASRQGDCSEHAVLAAAMCRAVGIPAQVVAGVTYVDEFLGHENVFGPHAWVRVWAGGKWFPLDATLPGGWDPGHIALAVGDGSPGDFFGIVSLLGNFKIDRVEVRR